MFNKHFQLLIIAIGTGVTEEKKEAIILLYKEALASHDYTYDYSDDFFVYQEGQRELSLLESTKNKYSFLLPTWEAYWREKQ